VADAGAAVEQGSRGRALQAVTDDGMASTKGKDQPAHSLEQLGGLQ